jgi:predicted MFS family arabinose efflux permease
MSLALTGRALTGALGPFLASVADSRGRRAGMLLGLALFSGGALLPAVWPGLPGFTACLLLVAAGKAVFDPSLQAYLGDRISYRRRGAAIAVIELSWSLSFIAGIPLAGWLIARQGWTAPFAILAGLGGLAMLILGWMLRGEARPAAQAPSVWRNLRAVLRHTPALLGLSVSFFCTAANEMVNLVFGAWMEDSFGLRLAALGAASAVIGIAELGGEGLVGLLTDRLGKPRAIGAGLVLNSLAALALPWLGRSTSGALAGLFLFYITFEFTLVSSIPLMTELLPAARATLMAANIAAVSAGRAGGALLATPVYAAGILGNGLLAAAFNLLALLTLLALAHKIEPGESGSDRAGGSPV